MFNSPAVASHLKSVRTSYALTLTVKALHDSQAYRNHFGNAKGALRTFRRRTSYAPLTTGSAEFVSAAITLRPCRGPADFPASNILCSPDNGLCRVFGAATLLSLHLHLSAGLSGVEHLMLFSCNGLCRVLYLVQVLSTFSLHFELLSGVLLCLTTRLCRVFGAAITFRPCNLRPSCSFRASDMICLRKMLEEGG